MNIIKNLCFLLLFLLLTSKVTQGQRRPRLCVGGDFDISEIVVDNITMSFEATVLENRTAILTLSVDWNVANPNGHPFDGFLVYLAEARNVDGTLLPINVCSASLDALWFNQSSCPNEASSPLCPPEVTPDESSCLCPGSNCSILGSVNCRGSPSFVTESGGNYVAIDSTVRSYQVAAVFHETYQVTILPYYRQFLDVSPVPITASALDCHSVISESEGLTLKESIQLCCENDIPHFVPLMAGIMRAQYNTTSEEVQITMNWRPPVFQDEDLGFTVDVYTSEPLDQERFPISKEVERVPSTQKPTDLDVECYDATYYYQTNISRLFLTHKYDIYIISSFSEEVTRAYCLSNRDRCSVRLLIDFSVIDLCEEQYGLCLDGKKCMRSENNSTVTYKCSSAKKTTATFLLLLFQISIVLLSLTLL